MAVQTGSAFAEGAGPHKFDAEQPAQGDANTPPKNVDRQTPGGAQTAPMPFDAQPVAPQVSDPREAGGNEGVKQGPSQQVAPEGDSKQPSTPSTAGPAAPTGP